MVATSAAVLARVERSGISAVDPRMGLQALQSILIASSSTVSASKGSNTLCNVVRLPEELFRKHPGSNELTRSSCSLMCPCEST